MAPDGPASTTASGRLPAFAAQTPPPTAVAGFTVETPLEASVLGRTFRAVGPDGKPVVLKLVEHEDRALRARVMAAVGALAATAHPNLAPVVASGLDGAGTPADRGYYVLPAPECVTVLDFVRKGRPLDGAEVAWAGAALASGLASLHARGIPHGAVSPTNVGILTDGTLWIVDLGWAPRVRDPELGAPGPKLAEALSADVGQLAALLVYATTGQAVKPRSSSSRFPRNPGSGSGSGEGPRPKALAERAAWLPPSLAALLDRLLDFEGRPTAAEAERLFRDAFVELGIQNGAPVDFLETARNLTGGRSAGAGATTQGSADASVVPAPSLGAFGRYVLLQEIARGGMGVVYRARHSELDRVFALKVLLSGELANDTSRARFLREAEAAARLDHPSIVRVHDYGEHGGRAYIAMDFAEGRSLTAAITATESRTEDLIALFAKVCDAVHYAHTRGIIHRDLKPQNVVVEKGGLPRILDFGVAKRLDEEARPGQAGAGLTTEGELVGTPAYMPPEQAEGRSKDIDTRSDSYALGVILFEIVTRGRLPFEGITVTDVLTKVLLEEPTPPSTHKPGLAWELDAIVLKALEKDPQKRYQSAAELGQDVRNYLSGVPIQARRANALYRARKWLVRNRRVVPFMGVALAAVVGTVAILAQQTAAARREKAARVAELVGLGQRDLVAGEAANLRAAQQSFAGALALDPVSKEAIEGNARASFLLSRLADEAEATRRASALEDFKKKEARGFTAKGLEALAALDADAARVAFLKALAFDSTLDEAQKGLTEASRIDYARLAAKEAAARKERDHAEATRLAGEGEQALAARDPEGARRAFFQALGFEPSSDAAREGLRKADGLAFEAASAAKRTQDLAEARRLVARGTERLGNREHALAKQDFVQALAFDGSSKDAIEGLAQIDRIERDVAAAVARKKARDEAEALAKRAQEALERGRLLAREGGERALVRTSFYEAIESFDRASFLAPEEESFARAKAQAARELAVLAKNQQDFGLSEYLFRIAGTAADTGTELAPVATTDDCLVVTEADAITVQRAFREPLEFEERDTRDYLASLRALVEPQKDRLVLRVEIRSRIAGGASPLVYVAGVTLRLEDKKRNTMTAPEKLDFEPTAHARLVVAGTSGRVVSSLRKSLANDAESVLAQLREKAQTLVGAVDKK